jgi:hypothetical protein
MGMVKELIKEITQETFPEEEPVVVATGEVFKSLSQ